MPKEQPLIGFDDFRQQVARTKAPPSRRAHINKEARKDNAALKEVGNELTAIESPLHQDDDYLYLISSAFTENNEQETGAGIRLDLRLIIDAIPFYVMLVDEEHNILLANKAVKQSLGLEPEQIIGKYCPKLVHGLDQPFPGCPLEEAVDKNRPTETELFDSEKNMWFQSAVYPTGLKTEEGRAVLLHMVRDITEKKCMEDTLQEQLHFLQVLIDTIPTPIFYKDAQGVYLGCNKAFEQYLGKAREEIVGKTVYSISSKDLADIYYKADIDLLEKLGVQTYESSVIYADGTSHDVVFYKAPFLNAANTVGGLVGTILDITERKHAEQELKRSVEKLRKTLEGTVFALSSVAEKRDPYTAGHQERVAQLASAIAEEMGLPDDQIASIRIASTLHDIGKISLPAEILSKPSLLTEIEFNMIKTHSQHGYEVLRPIEFPWPIAEIVLQHHERIDGRGYPQGLAGDDILLEARILAVADVIEAMASHRPYRPSHGLDKALDEINVNKGISYDARVVDACLRLFSGGGFEFK